MEVEREEVLTNRWAIRSSKLVKRKACTIWQIEVSVSQLAFGCYSLGTPTSLDVTLQVLLYCWLAQAAFATPQVSNTLLVDGDVEPLHSEPLSEYGPLETELMMDWASSTACWRGYATRWEIRDDRLWFLGTRECHGTRSLPASSVMPGVKESEVEATWYSGTLTIPEGELVRYVHGGWGGVFSHERRLHIEQGVLLSDDLIQLVAPGFAALNDPFSSMLPIFVPEDIAGAKMRVEGVEDDEWMVFGGNDAGRELRVRFGPDLGPSDSAVQALDQAMDARLRWTTRTRRYIELDRAGLIGWQDGPRGRSTILRTFAWLQSRSITWFSLELPRQAKQELATFTDQLSEALAR